MTKCANCKLLICYVHFHSAVRYCDIDKMCRSQLYFHEHWVQVIFFCLYATIFVVGVAGNLAVLCVILRNKHMRTTINLYLLNLSTSDIIMSVFSSAKLMGRWLIRPYRMTWQNFGKANRLGYVKILILFMTRIVDIFI